jgi:hypothetical protein
MKETVDKILRQEEEARQRIEAARQEAQEMVRKAQKDADSLLEQSRKSSHDFAEARKEEAGKGFTLEKEKELKLTLEDISAKRREKEKDIALLSQKVFLGVIRIKD